MKNLPTAEAAEGVLTNLYNNVFFSGLATQNIAPATQKEASDLLGAAHNIRVVESRQTKTANDHQVLAVLAAPVMIGNSDEELLKHASHLAQDPAIYDAVLSTLVAEQMVLDGHAAETVAKTAYDRASVDNYLRHKLAEASKPAA